MHPSTEKFDEWLSQLDRVLRSPRELLALDKCAELMAMVNGSWFLLGQNIKQSFHNVFVSINLSYEAEAEGISS